ncbi:unnamed protein product [Moneuplotes crassus]|uniref:SURF1-like protein n=1 Tax=Euplotes crassus TaxID=5936 RepID=A0AAD1XTY3_EUPCR|nr:unnamed protein product [Moneuplotes crassus]
MKKILFTTISAPFCYVTGSAYLWQKRRKIEKIQEIECRKGTLTKEPLDITPKNGEDSFNFNVCNSEDFKETYEYRPVKISGIYDHSKEIFVERTVDHHRGYCVLTPLYTHLNSKGDKVGIFVDRGWIDDEYRNSKIHYDSEKINKKEEIMGIIRDTEAIVKNYIPNDLKENRVMSIDVKEFEEFRGIKMPEIGRERYCFMRETDFGQKNKGNLYPQLPSAQSFLSWYVMPDRHQAYANFWLFLTCTIVGCNFLVYVAI